MAEIFNMHERMAACFRLRQKGYRPNMPWPGCSGYECISYPFPDDHGGVSIMIRQTGKPETMLEYAFRELDWYGK